MANFTKQLWWFGLKQAWACLFAGLLLAAMLVTRFYWPEDSYWPEDLVLARYDFLFLYALFLQVIFLSFKLETWDEAKVILLFHIVGTVMELFKTHMGSWTYPEESLFRIGGVPLFSGFMYASVGSYLARIWRQMDLRFTHYPPISWTVVLGIAIYINFFSHHFFWDIRYLLFAATVVIFHRCWVYFSVKNRRYRMPVLLALALGAFFIWIAENVATFSNIWIYPNQAYDWQIVPLAKYGSWFLLIIISGVLLTFVQKPEEEPDALHSHRKSGRKSGHKSRLLSARTPI